MRKLKILRNLDKMKNSTPGVLTVVVAPHPISEEG
jgi:hypothetical protein